MQNLGVQQATQQTINRQGQEQGMQKKQKTKKWEHWGEEEKQIFQTLYPIYKCDYKRYIKHLPGRTYNQIKCYYHNYIKKNDHLQQQCNTQPRLATLIEKQESYEASNKKYLECLLWLAMQNEYDAE